VSWLARGGSGATTGTRPTATDVSTDPNNPSPGVSPAVAQSGRLHQRYGTAQLHPAQEPSNLADILERVLDKGIVIAGDIQINLLDIELLTIKLRLIVASVDTARRMGIRWWETDPRLSGHEDRNGDGTLRDRVEHLEQRLDGGSRSRRPHER